MKICNLIRQQRVRREVHSGLRCILSITIDKMSIVSDSRDRTSKFVYVEDGTGKVTVYKWFTDATIIDSL